MKHLTKPVNLQLVKEARLEPIPIADSARVETRNEARGTPSSTHSQAYVEDEFCHEEMKNTERIR